MHALRAASIALFMMLPNHPANVHGYQSPMAGIEEYKELWGLDYDTRKPVVPLPRERPQTLNCSHNNKRSKCRTS